MRNSKLGWLKTWKAPLFSPKGFALRAIIIALAFAVCHWLGLREHTSFLSGTAASADTSMAVSALLGMLYMASYFGFVLVAPTFLVAAGIQGLLHRFWFKVRNN